MGKTLASINFEDLSSTDPKVKYGCSRNLIAISESNPAELYPHLKVFADLLKNENKILKWTGIIVIGNLAKVDRNGKIDYLMAKLIKFLNSGNMITANNSIAALSNIALAKPEYQKLITKELLKVEHFNYDTPECRNIALGKVTLALNKFPKHIREQKIVVDFIQRLTKNTRAATAKKAEQFLKKIVLNRPEFNQKEKIHSKISNITILHFK